MSKYIQDKPILGIKVDYARVNADFRKMMEACGAPSGLYNPCTLRLDEVNWSVLMSERSSSKTTQILLYCLMIWRDYGVKFAYVRRLKSQVVKAMYVKLFEVINDVAYGYVSYLTDGRYNSIAVTREKDVVFTDGVNESEPVGVLMNIEEYERYTSTFNTTCHDNIILDEFSWGTYKEDEFLHFCQLIATLRRERISVKIILLSNTISPYNQYLRELGISTTLAQLHKGQSAIITSPLGTKVYCELLDVGIHKTTEFNQRALSYFGFENESLRALYGGEWEIKGFKHLPRSADRKLEKSNIVLSYMGYNMRLCYFEDGLMYGAFIEKFTGNRKNYINVTDNTEYQTDFFNTSSRGMVDSLYHLDNIDRVYVSDNETGLAFYGLLDALRLKR